MSHAHTERLSPSAANVCQRKRSILQLHIRRLKYLFLKEQITSKADSIREHEEIIKAFVSRDAETAAVLMKQNWLRPMNELRHYLQGKEGV
ncbi:hypothetical protein [Brevibacillus sp. H7]|uniref:hypothetical protein n=1 Tax=Brevibacillus sp. H7 TaxID=3349138 RepID=UPI00383B7BC1